MVVKALRVRLFARADYQVVQVDKKQAGCDSKVASDTFRNGRDSFQLWSVNVF